MYYAAKIGFYCALAAYVVIEFMLIEVIGFLKTARRIEDLADSNAYNMLPGLMRLENDHHDDKMDEDDDDDMIRMAMFWMRLLMVVVALIGVAHYYMVGVTYAYWKKWATDHA